MQQLPLRVRLGEAARFDGFIAGPNAEVVDLLTGASPPRVLWLWGRAGTGKTHLLQAACAAASASGGSATYLDLAAGGAPGLLEGYETLDLVCLDALDRVSDEADWNAAIFRLYMLMQDAPGRLYVASTAPPASLRFRLPDLRSRLLAASVHQLHELDEAGQVAALERRAGRRGLELSQEAAAWLVHRMPRDMHSLCGVLDRLDDAALAAQRRLTVPFLRQVLGETDQAPVAS
jgi:DnaA family protein